MKKFKSPFPTHLETSLLWHYEAEIPTDGPPGERIELFLHNLWSILGFGSLLSNEGNAKNAIYYWASLVAQMVKNLPTVQETWVQFLHQDDPLEKEIAQTTPVFLPEEFYGQKSLGAIVHGVPKCWTWLRDFHSLIRSYHQLLITDYYIILTSPHLRE